MSGYGRSDWSLMDAEAMCSKSSSSSDFTSGAEASVIVSKIRENDPRRIKVNSLFVNGEKAYTDTYIEWGDPDEQKSVNDPPEDIHEEMKQRAGSIYAILPPDETETPTPTSVSADKENITNFPNSANDKKPFWSKMTDVLQKSKESGNRILNQLSETQKKLIQKQNSADKEQIRSPDKASSTLASLCEILRISGENRKRMQAKANSAASQKKELWPSQVADMVLDEDMIPNGKNPKKFLALSGRGHGILWESHSQNDGKSSDGEKISLNIRSNIKSYTYHGYQQFLQECARNQLINNNQTIICGDDEVYSNPYDVEALIAGGQPNLETPNDQDFLRLLKIKDNFDHRYELNTDIDSCTITVRGQPKRVCLAFGEAAKKAGNIAIKRKSESSVDYPEQRAKNKSVASYDIFVPKIEPLHVDNGSSELYEEDLYPELRCLNPSDHQDADSFNDASMSESVCDSNMSSRGDSDFEDLTSEANFYFGRSGDPAHESPLNEFSLLDEGL